MTFSGKELTLFGIGYVEKNIISNGYGKRDIMDAIGMSPGSFDRYLAQLTDSGYLEKNDGPKVVCGYSLTDIGKERYEKVYDRMLDIFLTPEQHSIHVVCPFKPLLKYLNDPLLILKIVSNTFQGKKMDIREFFQHSNLLRSGSGFNIMIDEILSIREEGMPISVEELLMVLTNMGIKPGETRSRMFDPDRIRSLLATAEFKRRSGNLEEAQFIYDQILQLMPGLSPKIWIIAYTYRLKCMMGLGRHDEVMKLIEHSTPLVKNSVHRAMIIQIKADLLSLKGEYEKSKELYRSCLGVYYAKELSILSIAALNNMGVMFFRHKQNDIAERMWRKAYRIAREKEILWAQAVLSMNIGDHIAFNKGQVKRGKDLVRNARNIMEQLNDMEGVSDAKFNYALVCLADGKVSLAIKHFNESMKYPILDGLKRDERIKVFNERLVHNGQKMSISFK
ncbi:MAG: tetratricopeptide repeat protein [Thermoplasmatota archaeon]